MIQLVLIHGLIWAKSILKATLIAFQYSLWSWTLLPFLQLEAEYCKAAVPIHCCQSQNLIPVAGKVLLKPNVICPSAKRCSKGVLEVCSLPDNRQASSSHHLHAHSALKLSVSLKVCRTDYCCSSVFLFPLCSFRKSCDFWPDLCCKQSCNTVNANSSKPFLGASIQTSKFLLGYR